MLEKELEHHPPVTPPCRVVTQTTKTGDYDEANNTLSNLDTKQSTKIYYDSAGRVARSIDAAGLTTNTSYAGNLVTTQRPNTATEQTTTHPDGQSISIQGPAGVSRNYAYGVDANGKVTITETVAGSNVATAYTADWTGRRVSLSRLGANDATLTTEYEYDERGRQKSATEMEGGQPSDYASKSLVEESLGKVTRWREIDNSSGFTLSDVGQITQASYEKIGAQWWQVSTTSATADNGGVVVVGVEKTARAGLSEEPRTTNAYGQTATVVRSVNRAQQTVTTTATVPGSTIQGETIEVRGYVTSQKGTTYPEPTTFTYDALGRLEKSVDPRTGTESVTVYNTLGQLSATKRVKAGVTVEQSDYVYFGDNMLGAGQPKSITRQGAAKIYYEYNEAGQVVCQWGSADYPRKYGYDGAGRLTSLTTYRAGGAVWNTEALPSAFGGAGDETRWVYFADTNLVEKKIDSANREETYAYHNNGMLQQVTRPRLGATTATVSYTYENSNRSRRLDETRHNGVLVAKVLSYSRNGQVKSVRDASGVRTYTYDSAGQITKEAITAGGGFGDLLVGAEVNRAYDPLGRRRELHPRAVAYNQLKSLGAVAYMYGAEGRLSQVRVFHAAS